PPQAFQIDPNELADLHDVLQLLELRLAVETEMAGLAAERRTDADIVELEKWLEILRDASGSEDGGVKADAALHASIARATGNQY
ncbi:FadR/GntR family transcriptional regulator, partial [Stenotrophomonas maltophilia]|uniref:FadR/GntR family transcriptional regulator n=2 Tax=Pseudomonadota TaxID=1224 RepID=UPI0013DB484F